MKNIHHLEMHITHCCNLSCESCSHYSNQGHDGFVSIAEADRWMGLWDMRLRPSRFSLLGGEITLHPELSEFVALARSHWPNSHLRLATNGFFLNRHPSLLDVLKHDSNVGVYLSIHDDTPEYNEMLRPSFELLKRWNLDYGIRVEIINSFGNWTRRYHGSGNSMEPYNDGQARQSWQNCRAKYTQQLFEGNIWKCAPLAYLKLQDTKYRLSDNWKPYLQYKPLGPDCTDIHLEEYFSREDERYCGMCPANPEKFKPKSRQSPLTQNSGSISQLHHHSIVRAG